MSKSIIPPHSNDSPTVSITNLPEPSHTIVQSSYITPISPKEKSEFMIAVKKVLSTPCPILHESPFKFEISYEAALFNSELILKHNGDLEQLLGSLDYSFTHYGSEFRSASTLENLLSSNNKWNDLKTIINNGVDYEMNPIDEKDRLSDIDFHLERGNHKSASHQEGIQAITKAFKREVSLGWQIPILPDAIKAIKGACITPLGVAKQWTINSSNERIIKKRVTHDCTFPGPSGLSANLRVPEDILDECLYGFALLRLLHEAHQMRFRHKHSRIFTTKTDMDSAYRRVHAALTCVVAVITVIPLICSDIAQKIAHILLRLPFGAKRAGAKFSIISDTVVDLATELSSDLSWDPKETHSDIYDLIENLPIKIQPSDVPLGQAHPLFINMKNKDIAFEGYIDDIIGIGIENPRIMQCLLHAPSFASHILFRPVIKSDPIKRNNIINGDKHHAEGLLEEVKVILGWKVDLRLFKVFLQIEKLKEWSIDIDEAISKKKIKTEIFESIIGRLNHAGYIVPFGKYFLNCLRIRLSKVRSRDYRTTIIEQCEIDDLILWKKLLFHACHNGIDINHITFTEPSITCYSDACEYGLGGYIVNGPAWRFKLPDDLVGYFSINFLEFIAAVLTIELAIHLKNDPSYPHRILSFTDNSSTLKWLFSCKFDPSTHLSHEKVGRHLAWLCTKNNVSLFSQHIPGTWNIIADSLSRDFHIPNRKLTTLILPHLPEQVRSQFKIMTHPRDIYSWIASLKCGNRTKEVSTKLRMKNNLPTLKNGEHTLRTLDSEMYGYNPSIQQTRISSSPPSLKKSETTSTVKSKVKRSSWQTPWLPPSVLYQRPFEKTHLKTQC